MSASDLTMMVILGVAGAAIGYGQWHSSYAACTGFGIGIIALPVLYVLAKLLL